MVSISDLIAGVNIALGRLKADACPALQNAQGAVDIAQLVTAVNNALNGCRSSRPDRASSEVRRSRPSAIRRAPHRGRQRSRPDHSRAIRASTRPQSLCPHHGGAAAASCSCNQLAQSACPAALKCMS
jgi:hypothetical protein